MKKTAMPTSKAKTAYGLLSEVRKLILAEPLRYCQSLYIKRVGEDTYDKFPSCGTVGCVAGWVATLKGGRRFSYDQTAGIAQNILGLNAPQSWALFDGMAAGDFAQTPQHAKAGAAHLARFQKRHAAQLKAKKV